MSRGGPSSGMRGHQIVIAALVVGVLLAVSGVGSASAWSSRSRLSVSWSPDRSGSVSLDGAAVKGETYVFLKTSRWLDRVEFYLDDPGRTRPPVRVDTIAPYDFAGTAADGRANPYDTRGLANGTHSITAVLRWSGASTSTRSASFTVANQTGTIPSPTSPTASTIAPTATVTTAPSATPTTSAPTTAAPTPTSISTPSRSTWTPSPTGISTPSRSTVTPAPSTSSPSPSTPTGGPSPTSTCTGQTINPATDVQAVVNKAPTGATFCFAPGTYSVAITPKSGQVFDGGNRGAILDGQNARPYAFRGVNTSNVTIRGFVVRNYRTPLQDGAIHSFGTTNWTIERNHITRNAASGLATDTGAKVLNNIIDHNGQQGYAAHGSNFLYEGNEIAYNNEDLKVDPTWEAGGGKAWATKDATFRNNHVHHNGGNGLWDDTNNINITYDKNTVTDNWGAGIYHEIGYDARITGNTVVNNGTATSQGGGQELGWLWNAGIQLRSSGALSPASPILISGNTVADNYNGIALLDSPATGCTNANLNEGAYGPCRIQNILVENNVVSMKEGGTGLVQDGSGYSVFTSQNVRFRNNTYHVSSATHPSDGHAYGWFAWGNTWRDWTGWKALGNDTGGSYNP